MQHTNKQKRQLRHARVHYAVSDTTLKGNTAPKVCRWLIAAGKRPDPFRTRKLSLPALMVLQPGGCGRVSYRRHKTINTQLNTQRRKASNQTCWLLPFLLFRFLLLNQHQPATTIGTTFPFALSLANLHSNHPTSPQRPVTAASMGRTQLISTRKLLAGISGLRAAGKAE